MTGKRGYFGNAGGGLFDACYNKTAFDAGASEEEAMPRCKVTHDNCRAVSPAEMALPCEKSEDAELQMLIFPSLACPADISAITSMVRPVHTCSHV